MGDIEPKGGGLMVAISVRTREGELCVVEAKEGQSLMEALRGAGLDVLGTCGGMCSCGSCHVYAGNDLLEAVSAPGEDERDMLDALSDVVEVKPCSRLACQIPVTTTLESLTVEIAPQL